MKNDRKLIEKIRGEIKFPSSKEMHEEVLAMCGDELMRLHKWRIESWLKSKDIWVGC